MMDCGIRVVRGPNWCWGSQDGGEGHVGTIREIKTLHTPTVHSGVTIQWDNGNQTNCRVGYLGKYDLRVVDNAQIGAKHPRIVCDGCDMKGITGIRYKCNACYDYDLCYMCYHGDKHDLSHPFTRFDYALSMGINLPPRLNARKCELKGIFKAAKVVRGSDWDWDSQDGGEGKVGIVMDIRAWDHLRSRAVANVRWSAGYSDVYRIGHKGYCDLKFIEPSSGGYYYPEHLPILGQREEEMELNQILHAIDLQEIMHLEQRAVEHQNEKCEQMQDSALLSLSPVESTYASIIMKYNEVINKGTQHPNLLDEFSNISNQFQDDEVKDIWNITNYMLQLPPLSRLDNVIKQRNSKTFTEALIVQAKRYLENKYKTYMADLVGENIVQASYDDPPNTYHLIHNFVGLRFKGEYLGFQDGMINDRPLWPMVYSCLRAGEISAAIYCLRKSFNTECQDIISILELRLIDSNHPEIAILQEKLRFLYRTTIRNCTDPFKRISWAILSCYDEISEAVRTADDFLWFKLNLVGPSGEGWVNYGELQYTILEEHGEAHYDAFNHPYMYFKLLMLTGQFEAAIEFLFRTEKFKVHSVHIAVTLNELNLLALPRDITSSLISSDSLDVKPARRLNLALVIRNYVEKFESKCLTGALHYFFLLRNIKDLEDQKLFEVYVSDLAIRTKKYEEILGKYDKNGVKSKGLIDQFMNSNIAAEIIAQTLVKQNKWEEAFDLYNIVNMQEAVLSLMCKMLSSVAHLESRPGSLRNKLQETADIIDQQFSKEGYKRSSKSIVNSFYKLKGLLTFFDQYRAKEYPEALKTLLGLKIVPLSFNRLEKRIENFKDCNDDLCRIIPDVLLATMAILLAQCDRIKKTDDLSEKHLHCVWEQANCITNFTERLQTKITGATLSRLIQMEILMHS